MSNYCKFHVVGHKRTIGEWFHDTSDNIRVWWSENRDWAIIVIPIVLPVALAITKKVVGGVVTNINIGKQNRLLENRIYDHSLGSYWRLKRGLSNSERITIEARRKAGESMGAILASMDILK